MQSPAARITVARIACLLWTLASAPPAPAQDPAAASSAELAARAADLVRRGQDDFRLLREAVRAYDAAIAADPHNLDARVALGQLFLSRYNAEDALRAFEGALARDENYAPALLGVARVRLFDGTKDGAGDVFLLLERVLGLDPDLAEARLLLARQHLDLEDFAAAEAEARRVLASDPRSPQAHALLAAAALLRGSEKGFYKCLALLGEVAPGDPEPFVTLAEIAARSRLYQRAVDLADRAVELDARCWRGWALRGVNRLRVGAVDAGRADLETAFAGNPFDVWAKNTLDLLDAMASYETVRTPRFELVLPDAEADLLALYLGPLAEEAYDALATRYRTFPPTPIRLEVFPRHADFSVRTVGLVGLGALGVCFGPVIAMDSPSARPPGEFHWGTTLWHELAHTFHMHLSASRVPRWFTEGLAVFEERRARPGWGDRVHPGYLVAYHQGRLARVEDLNQGFMRPSFPGQVVLSYLQSSLVFDHLVERHGFDAVVEMLRAYAAGKNTPEIFEEVLGKDLKTFAKEYDQAFRERFAAPLAAVEAERLEEAEALLGEIVGRSPDLETARARVESLEDVLYIDPFEIEDHRRLALWYEENGKTNEAVRERRAVLALGPFNRPQALYELARALLADGDRAGARRAVLEALEAAPAHEAALELLLELRGE